jgi:hypothetical protein
VLLVWACCTFDTTLRKDVARRSFFGEELWVAFWLGSSVRTVASSWAARAGGSLKARSWCWAMLLTST